MTWITPLEQTRSVTWISAWSMNGAPPWREIVVRWPLSMSMDGTARTFEASRPPPATWYSRISESAAGSAMSAESTPGGRLLNAASVGAKTVRRVGP